MFLKQFFLFLVLFHFISSENPQNSSIELLESSIKTTISELSNLAAQFNETRNSTIKSELKRNGFTYFSQSIQIQKVLGLKYAYFSKFTESLIIRLEIPISMKEKFASSMKDIFYQENSEWKSFNMMFSINNDSCKYISIMGYYHKDTEKADLLIGEVKAKFKFAQNLLIVEESVSYNGGAYSETKIKIKEAPVNVTDDEIKATNCFFKIVCLKGYASFFGIQAEWPEIGIKNEGNFIILKENY